MPAARIYTLPTPYTEDQLFDLGFEQSADVMYLTHVDHPPRKLSRYDHASWILSVIDFGATTAIPQGVSISREATNTGENYRGRPFTYVVTAVNGDTGQESLQSASVTIENDLELSAGNINIVEWDAVTGASRYNIYRSENGVFGFIGAATDTTFTDRNYIPDLSLSPPENREPFNGAYDKPARVSFFQQRTVWARTKNKPNGMYFSQSGDFENLNVSQPLRATDAVTMNLVARQVNAIQHLVPLSKLIVLTSDNIFAISGEPFTATNVEIEPSGMRGSSRVRPAIVDNMAFFNTALGGAIRTLNYSFQDDGYTGNDITVFAPHLFRGLTVNALSWADYPTQTLWVVRSDGKVPALTWQREQDVWGWSLCQTDGVVEDACTVTENGESVTYFVVRRTVQAQQVRFIERIASPTWASVADAVHLDCSRSYSGTPATVIRGMEHLEGRTVNALADGIPRLGLVVSGGKITLPQAASKVHVGLPYEAWIRTLPPPIQGRDGSQKGKSQQVTKAVLSVIDTWGLEVGPGRNPAPGAQETSDGECHGFRPPKLDTNIGNGAVTGPVTGDLHVTLGGTDWRSASVVVRQKMPLPMILTGISYDLTAP